MKLAGISNIYLYNLNQSRMPICRTLKTDSLSINSKISSKEYNISFSGLFGLDSKKRKEIPPIYISSGENILLKSGESIELKKDLLTFSVGDSLRCDLNSRKFSQKIHNLKDGQELAIKSRKSDEPSVLLYRNGKKLYLKNISDKDISLFSDSCFKNYDEESLVRKFSQKQISFYNLISNKYNDIRHAMYDEKTTFPCGKEVVYSVSKQDKPNLLVLCSDGWFFRIPKTKMYTKSDSLLPERMSLNVVANPSLIEELDEFFLTGKYVDSEKKNQKVKKSKLEGINYKVPYRVETWLGRHDPITIYSKDSFSPEVIDAIANLTEKYRRESSNGIALVGALNNKPWIALEKDYTEEDFLKLKEKVEKVNPAFADAMCQHVYTRWNYQTGYSDFSASTGLINSCIFLFDEYIEYLNHYSS